MRRCVPSVLAVLDAGGAAGGCGGGGRRVRRCAGGAGAAVGGRARRLVNAYGPTETTVMRDDAGGRWRRRRAGADRRADGQHPGVRAG